VAIIDSAFDNSERELSQVLSYLSDAYGSFHNLRTWSLTMMSDWKYGWNGLDNKTDPGFFSRNLHMWWDGPRLLSFAVSESGEDMTLQVGRDQRLLEERMLEWTEKEWGKGMDRIIVRALANDAWRQNILKSRGYRMVGSRGFLRRYDTAISPHEVPLEKGFSLSDPASSNDEASCIDVLSKALSRPFIDKEWFESKKKAPGYLANMVVWVMSPEGRCVAYAKACIDWKQNYAGITPIAVHPDYRLKGFERVCLAESMRRLANVGIRDVYIRSHIESSTSDLLYDSMLPIEKVEELSWELTK